MTEGFNDIILVCVVVEVETGFWYRYKNNTEEKRKWPRLPIRIESSLSLVRGIVLCAIGNFIIPRPLLITCNCSLSIRGNVDTIFAANGCTSIGALCDA